MNCQAHGRDYKNDCQTPGELCQQGHGATRPEGCLADTAESSGDINVFAALEKYRANEQDAGQDVNHLNYNHHAMESLSLGASAARVIYQGSKGIDFQTRPAHQRPVNFFLRHQRADVVRFDAAAVQNPDAARLAFAELPASKPAKETVRLRSHSGVAVRPVPMAHTGS